MRKERILGREKDVFSSTLAFWLFLRDISPGGSQASDWISRDRRFRDIVGDMNLPHRGDFCTQCGLGHRRQVKGKVAWRRLRRGSWSDLPLG